MALSRHAAVSRFIPRGCGSAMRVWAGTWINTSPPVIIPDGRLLGSASSAGRSRGKAMSGGRAPRCKGNRLERVLVRLLQAHGFNAARVPLSGTAGGRFSGDLAVPLLGRDLCVEVKARADGFRELYSWLTERDVLIVKADRQEPLGVLRLTSAVQPPRVLHIGLRIGL